MGIALHHERAPHRPGGKGAPRKPNVDEMGPGPESAPYRGPRSTMGRPGQHGGFKPKRR
jgi:excinuclease ABC subunit B